MLLFELASHLRIPIYKMAKEMPYEEFLGWLKFFELRPRGWEEDARSYKLLQAWGIKEPAEDVFPSLRNLTSQKRKKDAFDVESFKGSYLFQKI